MTPVQARASVRRDLSRALAGTRNLLQSAMNEPTTTETPRSDEVKRYFTQSPCDIPLFGQDPEIAWVPIATARQLEKEVGALRREYNAFLFKAAKELNDSTTELQAINKEKAKLKAAVICARAAIQVLVGPEYWAEYKHSPEMEMVNEAAEGL